MARPSDNKKRPASEQALLSMKNEITNRTSASDSNDAFRKASGDRNAPPDRDLDVINPHKNKRQMLKTEGHQDGQGTDGEVGIRKREKKGQVDPAKEKKKGITGREPATPQKSKQSASAEENARILQEFKPIFDQEKLKKMDEQFDKEEAIINLERDRIQTAALKAAEEEAARKRAAADEKKKTKKEKKGLDPVVLDPAVVRMASAILAAIFLGALSYLVFFSKL